MASDVDKLVCAPCDGRTDPALWSEGSVFDRQCAACGVQVVVGKAGQEMLAGKPEMVIECFPCMVESMARGEHMKVALEAAPGAIDEFNRFMKKKEH